jgi:large subunit ribosomal protein L9
VKSFETRKAQLEVTNLETRKEAEAVGAKLDGQIFVVIRSASDAGALYGSVTARDAADAATAAGFTVNRGQVVLKPIKDLGLHTVSVVLHPEVSVKIRLNVARLGQASGKRAAAGLGQVDPGTGGRSRSPAEFEIAESLRRNGRAACGPPPHPRRCAS